MIATKKPFLAAAFVLAQFEYRLLCDGYSGLDDDRLAIRIGNSANFADKCLCTESPIPAIMLSPNTKADYVIWFTYRTDNVSGRHIDWPDICHVLFMTFSTFADLIVFSCRSTAMIDPFWLYKDKARKLPSGNFSRGQFGWSARQTRFQ
jgi:hypothetical protein